MKNKSGNEENYEDSSYLGIQLESMMPADTMISKCLCIQSMKKTH